MPRLGFGLGLDVKKIIVSGGSRGPASAITAYFMVDEPSGKILKIMPDGTVHTWHTYAGALEPEGCIVDSKNERLYVLIGNAGTRQVDRFDNLTGNDSGGSATKTLASTQYGGNGTYVYSTDEIYYASPSGATIGIFKIDADLTTVSEVLVAKYFRDFMYWPPDDEAICANLSPSSIWAGELDGSGWSQSTTRDPVTDRGIAIPPAHEMGDTEYMFLCAFQIIHRYSRYGGGKLNWLVLTTGLDITPAQPRIDFVNGLVVFIGVESGGIGTDGIYTAPLQQGAHSDQSGVVKIADITSQVPSMTAGSGKGLEILFNGDPTTLMVDIAP